MQNRELGESLEDWRSAFLILFSHMVGFQS